MHVLQIGGGITSSTQHSSQHISSATQGQSGHQHSSASSHSAQSHLNSPSVQSHHISSHHTVSQSGSQQSGQTGQVSNLSNDDENKDEDQMAVDIPHHLRNVCYLSIAK